VFIANKIMSEEFSIDKKWKYVQFLREDSPEGWSLDFSDERSGIPRDRLLSVGEAYRKSKESECFSLVINAISSDPQLIEFADGLYEASQVVGTSPTIWRILPIFFNRSMWRQLSSYLRFRQRHFAPIIESCKFEWMSKKQLQLTLRLMTESLGITDKLALLAIEQLITDKEEE
jgi:hypothetical protein